MFFKLLRLLFRNFFILKWFFITDIFFLTGYSLETWTKRAYKALPLSYLKYRKQISARFFNFDSELGIMCSIYCWVLLELIIGSWYLELNVYRTMWLTFHLRFCYDIKLCFEARKSKKVCKARTRVISTLQLVKCLLFLIRT